MNNSGTLTIIIIIIIIKVSITAHCLPAESQHDKVRHQEGPAPRFVSVVRKPPDVAQAHGVTNASQQEGDTGAPGLPVLLTRHREYCVNSLEKES